MELKLEKGEIDLILNLIMSQFKDKPKNDDAANKYRQLYGSIMYEIENQ